MAESTAADDEKDTTKSSSSSSKQTITGVQPMKVSDIPKNAK